jgi:hypothetical protein
VIYLSGETVMVGDIVRVTVVSGTTEARVVAVLAPGSAEALSWNAPVGGVMIDCKRSVLPVADSGGLTG